MINSESSNETIINSKHFVNMWKDKQFITDDYMKLTNSHWLQFMPPNFKMYYIWGIVYAIVMILGCIGNFLAVFIILKFKSLKKSVNVLLLNLAICDFLLLANTFVVTYNSYYQGPALGNLGCQIDGFIGSITRMVSTMTITAISIERYSGIVHPLISLVKNTKNNIWINIIWIGMMWIYGFLFSILPFLNLDYGYAPEGFLINCNIDYLTDNIEYKLFIMIFYTGECFISFIITLYCYIKISKCVFGHTEISNCRVGQESIIKKTEFMLGITISIEIILYALSWMPNVMVEILGIFEKVEYISPMLTMVTTLISKLCSSINPWLYIILPKGTRTSIQPNLANSVMKSGIPMNSFQS